MAASRLLAIVLAMVQVLAAMAAGLLAIVLAMVQVLAAMAAGLLASASVSLLWMCTGRAGHHITWSLHGVPRGGFQPTADLAGTLRFMLLFMLV